MKNRHIIWKEDDDYYFAYNNDDIRQEFPLACIIEEDKYTFLTDGLVFTSLYMAKIHSEKAIRGKTQR